MSSNAQKAATLLQNLPDIEATNLRAQLSAEQHDRLLQATADAITFNDEWQLSVLQEFLQLLKQETPSSPLEESSSTLTSVPSDCHQQAATLPEDLLFQFFHCLQAKTMFSLIQQESAQTIAVILSRLPMQQSVAVSNQFNPELRANIVHQVSKLGPVDIQTLVQIAEVLQQRLERLQNHASLLAEK